MSRAQRELEELDAQLDILRNQLDEIDNMEEPEGGDAVRAQIVSEREKRFDDIIVQYQDLEAKRPDILQRANDAARIREAAKDMTRVESGDGARFLGGTGPAVIKKVDPFEGDVMRASTEEVVTRARHFIEDEKRVYISDANRERLDQWVQRSADDDDEDNSSFDGSYIARRALLTENKAYRNAFRKYAAGREIARMSPEEQAAVYDYQRFEDREIRRAGSENTTTAGGFGIPVIIDPTIILTSGAADVPLLRVCRIETVTNNLWEGVSSAGMTWAFSTEATEASDNFPTLAQPTVRVHKAQGFLPYSIEVAQDYPGFATEFGRLIDSGYTDLLATKTMTGTGTVEPFGIFVALSNATSVITPTTDGSFGGQDIFKAWNSLPERFRTNATWVMSVNVQSAIRQFAANTTSVQSAYFTIDLTGGTFRINERPVIITDYAPTGVGGSVPGTTGLQNILAVADFQQAYIWVQRAGMAIEQIPMLFGSGSRFPLGQRGLYAWARVGGNTVSNRAGILLQNQ